MIHRSRLPRGRCNTGHGMHRHLWTPASAKTNFRHQRSQAAADTPIPSPTRLGLDKSTPSIASSRTPKARTSSRVAASATRTADHADRSRRKCVSRMGGATAPRPDCTPDEGTSTGAATLGPRAGERRRWRPCLRAPRERAEEPAKVAGRERFAPGAAPGAWSAGRCHSHQACESAPQEPTESHVAISQRMRSRRRR